MNEDKNTMNQMILSKREETEKHINSEYIRLKNNLDSLQSMAQHDIITSEMLQKESASLNHQSAYLSGKIAHVNHECIKKQEELVTLETKRDELSMLQNQAQIVLDKETLTNNLWCNRMQFHAEKIQEFWEQENKKTLIKTLNEKKNDLKIKRKYRLEEIEKLRVKAVEGKSALQKLDEEIMILKKRNAAYLKRMNRRLEYLKQQLASRKSKLRGFSLISNK